MPPSWGPTARHGIPSFRPSEGSWRWVQALAAPRFHVDVIAFVDDIQVRVRGLQAAVIGVHAHARRRNAVTRLPGEVVAVRHPANGAIAGRAAARAGDRLTLNTPE